jgi:RNA polymerase sigma factor (sigma-70 family)
LCDAELLVVTREGDVRAFGELWRRHRFAALAAARRITLRFDAEDLVAESFARVFQAIAVGGGPQIAFRSYLTTTIRNVAVNWSRAQPAVASLEVVPELSDGADHIARVDSVDSLARALDSLPERWRLALWYSGIEGLSSAEMASMFGISPSAVGMLTLRARRGLARALQAQGSDFLPDL